VLDTALAWRSRSSSDLTI